MYSLKIDRKNGREYLYLVRNTEGKRKRIFSLGTAEHCLSSMEDPVSFFRKLVRVLNEQEQPDYSAPVPMKKGGEIIFPAELYIRMTFRDLGLHDFFRDRQKQSRALHSFCDVYSLLVTSRILEPGSINFEYLNSQSFFHGFRLPRDSLYRYLDYFADMDDQIQEVLYDHAPDHFRNRSNQRLLYDGTNIFFHARQPDRDVLDPKTETVIRKALRTHGFSKENRILPILNIGLFCSEEGYPVIWNIFAGREKESTNILPVLGRALKDYGFHEYTFEADRANSGGKILAYIQRVDLVHRRKEYDRNDPTDHFIVGKSIRQSSDSLKQFALETGGYKEYKILDSNFSFHTVSMKSRIFNQTIRYYNAAGKQTSTKIPQLQIVYHSEPYARRESYRRAEDVRELGELLDNPSRLNAKVLSGKLKYSLAEGVKPSDILKGIDMDKIREARRYDGFYVILSNLFDESPGKVYCDYKELYFDEQDFRILKSLLKLRPAFLRTPEHLKAYVTICMTSLVILRWLEYVVDHEFTVSHLLEGLRDFYCIRDENDYRILYTNPVIEALRKKSGIGFEHALVSRNELERKMSWSEISHQLKLFE